jgi:hypothetical protein
MIRLSHAVRIAVGVAVVATALLAGVAQAADPPIGTIGLTSPDGSQTVSGAIGADGTTDACVNGQHSSASPSSAGSGSVLQLNDAACAAGSPSPAAGAGGSQAAGAGSGSAAGAGSAAAGASGATAAGASTAAQSAWVSATAARGLRIARVQYLTRDVTLTKRFRVWVTLRDLNGRRVRDAVVRVGPVAGARYTVAGAAATYTDRNGQARLVLTATSSMLGRLVMLQIAARTPSVRAATVGTVRLPRVAPR